MWWRSVVFLGIVFGAMFFIIPQVVWLVSWLVGKVFSVRVSYLPFLWTALILTGLVWLMVAYGHYIGRFRSEVTQTVYSSTEVPRAFDGFRIAHISDLHVDSFDDHPEVLRSILEQVNEQHPDIILFTGDMTTAQMDRIPLHEEALKVLKAPEGVVSVMGNHDFFIYCPELRSDRERCAMADRLTTYEREHLDWQVLRNDHLLLRRGTDSLAIAGVDNINGNQGFRTIQRGDLRKAIQGMEGVFTVLLTHDPSHWEAEVLPKSRAQITLSGHTHAAQMRLFGWSLANLAFRECDGRYDRNGRMLYVNAGIGCTAPFRIDCPAEITVITLKRAEN